MPFKCTTFQINSAIIGSIVNSKLILYILGATRIKVNQNLKVCFIFQIIIVLSWTFVHTFVEGSKLINFHLILPLKSNDRGMITKLREKIRLKVFVMFLINSFRFESTLKKQLMTHFFVHDISNSDISYKQCKNSFKVQESIDWKSSEI